MKGGISVANVDGNFNMAIADLNRLQKQIKRQLKFEDYTPILALGKSGIGKTEVISGLAKELGIGFVELRLGQWQEEDLVGLPFVDEKGKSRHAETDLLPDSSDQGQGILMLDEVTSSNKHMRATVYQLTDSRRSLGTYKLPPKWMVVACGNGPYDGGDFEGIESALLSRCRCMRVEENLDAWKAWAIKKGVHPTVVAFLSFMPDKLHVLDPEGEAEVFACPRSWVKLSEQLLNMETEGPIDPDELAFTADICVGTATGPSFAAFYQYNKSVVTVEDILNGTCDPKTVDAKQSETMYILVQQIVSFIQREIKSSGVDAYGELVKKDEITHKMAKITNWLIDLGTSTRLDVAVMAIQDITNNIREAKEILISTEFDLECPRFTQFAIDNVIIFE